MERRTLRTGMALTELGLGTSQLGNLGRVTTEAEAGSAVGEAWSRGVRYVDTAPHYGLGLSERRLGERLADHDRAEYVLSTKVGRLLVADPDGSRRLDDHGFAVPATTRRKWDFSADGVRRSIDDSLMRLGLDRIDIVYLHDPDAHWDQASRQAVPALIELRDQGVIGAIGAGMNQSAMLAELVRRCDIDVVMCAGRYTLLEQPAALDLLPIAQERGIGVVVAGVYNSGLLSQPRPAANATYNYEAAPGDVVARAHRIADVCERHDVTLPAAAIAFPLRHPAVVSVVVGCRNGEQVRDAVERYTSEIPDGLWAELTDAGLIAG